MNESKTSKFLRVCMEAIVYLIMIALVIMLALWALLVIGSHIAKAATPPTGIVQELDTGAQVGLPAVRLNPPEPLTTEEIIRAVWPHEWDRRTGSFMDDWAVRIAKRESGPNLLLTAHNYCCYGIFQIYFKVHRDWLDEYGVFVPSDLYDPWVNATVALALYRMSGPGNWSTS